MQIPFFSVQVPRVKINKPWASSCLIQIETSEAGERGGKITQFAILFLNRKQKKEPKWKSAAPQAEAPARSQEV